MTSDQVIISIQLSQCLYLNKPEPVDILHGPVFIIYYFFIGAVLCIQIKFSIFNIFKIKSEIISHTVFKYYTVHTVFRYETETKCSILINTKPVNPSHIFFGCNRSILRKTYRYRKIYITATVMIPCFKCPPNVFFLVFTSYSNVPYFRTLNFREQENSIYKLFKIFFCRFF